MPADAAIVAIAVQQVIALRLKKLAAGGAVAHTEAMNDKRKMGAAFEAGTTLATGGSPKQVVRRVKPAQSKLGDYPACSADAPWVRHGRRTHAPRRTLVTGEF